MPGGLQIYIIVPGREQDCCSPLKRGRGRRRQWQLDWLPCSPSSPIRSRGRARQGHGLGAERGTPAHRSRLRAVSPAAPRQPPGCARPALTFRAVPSPAEVLGAAIAEGSAQREAEEVEHPAGGHGLGLGYQLRVLLLRDLQLALGQLRVASGHLILWTVRIFPACTVHRAQGR